MNRFSPDLIMSSPEKCELVESLKKAKAIHEKITAIDDKLLKLGVVTMCVHDEIEIKLPENDDSVTHLLHTRVGLIKELDSL